ncbi:TAP-like domain-containing protein [Trichoderma sp. SZMC 28015]
MRVVVGIVLNNLAVLAAATYAHDQFDWASISPSKDLIYHDCFDGFKCARLIAPLDYKNDSDSRTVAIAMIKLPAVVSDDDRAFAGFVFTNPGGPGGAGVGFMPRAGKGLRDVLDKPGLRHYEIVSFDPRGIGNSWPRANCFVHDTLRRDAISLELRGRGPLNSRGGTNVPYILAIQKAIGLRCQDAEANGIKGGQIMAYMGTPNVACDMVHMVDKIAELRARDTRKDHVEPSRVLNKGNDDIPRLQHIGYSYGTVLGIYFASLFPGRVGRIALDGVVDVDDCSSGPGWMTNLVDTDEIADRFFSGCHEVGRKICALSRNGDKSDASIKSRFYSWLSKLDEEPISTIGRSGEIIIIRSQDIREMLGAALYRPRSSFITLAAALDSAMGGDTAAIVKILFQRHIPHLDDDCAIDNIDSEAYLQEGTASVLCADGDSVTDYDVAWWKQYINQQINTSSIFGAYWSNIRMACNSWNFRPNWIFKGPFTTPPVIHSASGNPLSGHPAAPILFISNRLDPITPLSAARAMAAQHPGAGLVITEGLGHGTMGTSDSVCLHSYVADYFDTGVVPAGEVTCIPDCGRWDIDCDAFGVEIMPDNNHGYGRGPLAF